jgi:pantothenate kinase
VDTVRLAGDIKAKAGTARRYIIGIAGPPGSGKSTLAENLKTALDALGETAIVVPMDGFHFDDVILNARGHRARKGAPHTFDVPGFEALLKRIKAREPDIAIPVFDRKLELSRAAADIVDADTRFVLVEGLYLLLRREPWARLKTLFDASIFLDVPQAELERRLTERWLGLGFDAAYAKNWIASNDLPNMRAVIQNSAPADFTVSAA